MQPKKSKTVTRVLWITLLLSTIAAVSLGWAQVLPSETKDKMEAYEAQWTLPLSAGASVSMDLSQVNLVVRAHDGDTVEASFVGQRSANSKGELPYIDMQSDGQMMTAKEVYSEKNKNVVIKLGFTDNGRLQGTLTVLLPRVELGHVAAQAFSGSVSCEDITAASVALDTSSGRLQAHRITAQADITANSFSGGQTLTDISARSLDVDASSGNISAQNVTVQGGLSVDNFSGGQTLTGISAHGVELSSSSGAIRLADIDVTTLEATTFSGPVSMDNITAEKTVVADTSSGAVTIQGLAAKELRVKTYSGDVRGQNVDVATCEGDTSSGVFAVAFMQTCGLTVDTFSGDVEVIFPADAAFDYEIDTFSGRVNIGYTQRLAPGSVTTGKGELSGSVGEGEHKALRISTSSGDVSIGPREAK